MSHLSVDLLGLRLFVSCIGLVGNIFLILFIFQTRVSHIKSFELFLLGLASFNLEEIVSINVYHVIILDTVFTTTGAWWCRLLKFMTTFGEIASILFTVVICIFRYQKLRDVDHRGSLPICLDSIASAWTLSGVCVTLSALLSLPMFAITFRGSVENATENRGGCPTDFFQCGENYCPILNCVYKYLIMLLCHLLPLIIVTVTSCLTIVVLLGRTNTVTPANDIISPDHHPGKSHGFYRSTVAVVAAMGLFQVDWTLYLILQWTFSPSDCPIWVEIEFFISASYMSISPYVYGIGGHLFSLENCKHLLKH
ncbi:gonadotropin-releasing hormone receptor [Xiphophorus couchianus]|uniref:gonadotropin-releasing hormone receptor n=1 Tax=Xiphophorus couchianus TaxID=32473 RepID=UPI001015ECBB|nr:gonadotropin-releasing hormone receptor-like [Xiphophorus couchianus]